MAKSISRRLADSASPTGAIDGTLSTAAQTNITSVGTLSALAVTGDLTVDTSTLKVDSTNNRVGIGTSSPASLMHLSSSIPVLSFTDTNSFSDANDRFIVRAAADSGNIQWYDDSASTTTELMTFLPSGNVGIGTTSPASVLHLSTSNDPKITLTDTGFGASADITGSNGNLRLNSQTATIFDMADSEVARIDSSGNLLVGGGTQSNPTGANVVGASIAASGEGNFSVDGAEALRVNRLTSTGAIVRFMQAGQFVGSAGTTTSAAGTRFALGGVGDPGIIFAGTGVFPAVEITATDNAVDLGSANYRWKNTYLSGFVAAGDGSAAAPSVRGTDTNTGLFFPSGGVTAITRNGVEGARMDASGNFLVGRTSVSGTGMGHCIRGGDSAIFSRDSTGESCIIARNNTPGPALRFNSNGANIGGIGTHSAGGVELYMGNGSNIGFRFEQTGADRIEPCVGLGQSTRNNAIDLGISGNQWRSIYCETVHESSDRTLKQDIEALSDAEQRVAVAAKSLLRKYRLISDVEKEDNRYSFGIIAQDLQAAFAAEGLDAANYKMWNEATFTEETTGEEKTQQNIVYSQLLAFLISAI